jgi:PAS domain S-box-containing protein
MLFVSTSVLLLTGIILISYEFTSSRHSTAQSLSTLAQTIAANSTAALVFKDDKVASEILSGLKSDPDILGACLFDAEGELFASYKPQGSPLAMPERPGAEEIRFSGSRMSLFEPVTQGSARVGTLYVEQHLSGMYRRLSIYAGVVIFVLAIATGVAFILSRFFQRQITDPILVLAEAARHISEHKDFSVRAPGGAEGEVALLTDAFNNMVSEVQSHQRKLSDELAARQRAEAALRHSEQELRFVTDHTSVLIAHVDRECRLRFANKPYAERFGGGPETLRGRHISEVVGEEGYSRIEPFMRRALEGEKVQFEIRIPFKSLGERWMLVDYVPERSRDGVVPGFVAVIQDVTDRREMQEALREAHQKLEKTVESRTAQLRETVGELEAFSYSISHDMRGPLRAITAYCSVLIEDMANQLPEEAIPYIKRMQSASKRLDQLITDVLAYSRAARTEQKLERINVESLVHEIIQHHPNLQAPAAQIEIRGSLPEVLGQQASLAQCISNLLTNAVKFVAPGVQPSVVVRPESLDGEVRLWFEDNGIGIQPKDVDRIFRIFERVHSQHAFEGTGIGLAIVKKAIERMGGKVGVHSELGKGSQFWIQLKKA